MFALTEGTDYLSLNQAVYFAHSFQGRNARGF